MGWTELFVGEGFDKRAFIKKEFSYDGETHVSSVLDIATAGSTYYLAVERTEKATGKREVYAGIILTSYRKAKGTFAYKYMTEHVGPYYFECPIRILNQLTPTDDKYALEWRAECLTGIKRKERLRGLSYGDVIEFERPLNFPGYGKRSRFKVTDAKRRSFIALPDGLSVSIMQRTLREEHWDVKA